MMYRFNPDNPHSGEYYSLESQVSKQENLVRDAVEKLDSLYKTQSLVLSKALRFEISQRNRMEIEENVA